MAEVPSIVSLLLATSIASLVAQTLLLVAYAAAWWQDRDSWLKLWTAAWGFGVVRALLATAAAAATGPSAVLDVLGSALLVASVMYLYAGTLSFTSAGSLRWPGRLMGLGMAIWAVLSWPLPFFERTIAIYLFAGVVQVAAGVRLYRANRVNMGGRVTGIALVVWGLHRLDYPFVRPTDWAGFGFLLSTGLELAVASGLLLTHIARIRERLEASERRYRELFDRVRVGVFTTHERDGVLIDGNPAMARLMGYRDAAALRGVKLAPLFMDADAPTRLASRFDDAGGVVENAEVRLRRVDGVAVDAVLFARRVDNDAGGPIVQGMLIDVTERNRLAERVQQAERMEAIGRLAGGIAHDFNNLLTVIRAGVEVLGEMPGMPEPALDWVRDLDQASERAALLTRGLLGLSRHHPDAPRVIDLAEAVRDAHRVLVRMVGERIRLRLDLPSTPVPVRIDPSRLEQVLLNLVVNARDAMPDGGTVMIGVYPEPLAGEVVLTVLDDGAGLDETTLKRVFEPFFRATHEVVGTGMGLGTAWSAVTAAGGDIDVASTPGRGTTFTVRLPMAEGPIEPAPVPSPPRVSSATLRVLVIEDDPDVREVVAQLVQGLGYTVFTSDGGESAVARVEAGERFDVLVSDVVMPGLSGPETVARLRALLPDIRVLYVTGYPYEEGDRLASEVVLPKPFSSAQLAQGIGRALAGP